MDFGKIKANLIKFKNEAIDKSAKAIASSKFTISTKQGLDDLVKKSKTTNFISKETGEEKQSKHRSIVVFGEEKSDFFKEALYGLPILVTKAFSQSISLKLAKSNIDGVKLSDYKIKNVPALVVFEEEKVLKVIEGEENIKKIVKTLNLDINKVINTL